MVKLIIFLFLIFSHSSYANSFWTFDEDKTFNQKLSKHYNSYKKINMIFQIDQLKNLTVIDLKLENNTKIKSYRIKFDSDGKYTYWIGKIMNDPFGKVILTYGQDNKLAAIINTGGKFYRLHIIDKDYYLVETNEQNSPINFDPKVLDFITSKNQQSTKSINANITTKSDNNYIDILFAYTDDVKTHDSNVETVLAGWVASINQSLEDSCVNFRYRLVHQYEEAYNETGDLGTTDFNCWYSWTDGCLDDVHTHRDTYGADLFTLIVLDSGTSLCGKAHGNGILNGVHQYYDVKGDSVAGYNCGADTVAHEWGHNIGLIHDRYQHDIGQTEVSADYIDGYGFVDLVNKKRSIMSYSAHCTDTGVFCDRISKFSNPNIKHDGIPFGIEGFANATRMLNERYGYIANFRPSKSSYSPKIDQNCLKLTDGKNKDVHCFIATAAFGSYMHEDVLGLRLFRDNVLKNSKFGNMIIDIYYSYSPTLAKFVRHNETLKFISRIFIKIILCLIHYWYIFISLTLFLIMLLLAKNLRPLKFFILIFFMIIGLTHSENVHANLSLPSIFKEQISNNPATRLHLKSPFLIGVKFNSSQSELDKTGFKVESKSKLMSLQGGFYMSSFFIDAILYSKEDFDIKTTRTGIGEVSNTKESSQFKVQAGYKVPFLGSYGIKFQKVSFEGNETKRDIFDEKTLGVGYTSFFLNLIRLGVYADLVNRTGEQIADAKWINTGFGVGIINGPFIFEYNLERSPEVSQTQAETYTVKGNKLKHNIVFEFGSFHIPILRLNKLHLGISKETEDTIKPYNDQDISTSTFDILIGGQFLFNLNYSLGYRSEKIESATLTTQKTILLSLSYPSTSTVSSDVPVEAP